MHTRITTNARIADEFHPMATQVTLDGVTCSIQKLPDGLIKVEHASTQFNALHGAGTGGQVSFVVHPCQRHQYEVLNGHLPPQERTAVVQLGPGERPWWSLGAGERANLKE
jgi:hypothetical protein